MNRKLNISFFITDTYFTVSIINRLYSLHYFIMKILNRRKFQQISINHSSDIDFKGFMKIYKKCTAKPYPLLVYNTSLLS